VGQPTESITRKLIINENIIFICMNNWGFLRETEVLAQEAGIDEETGLHRTGLEKYLKVIFPEINDWKYNREIGNVNGTRCKKRPDYRSEELKLIVEFDGVPHFTYPNTIKNDIENTELYEGIGYKVVRIPYFIQLTNVAVKTLFNRNITEELFAENISSLRTNGQSSPAYLCPAGLKRMAEEFRKFPEQYKTNINFLRAKNDPFESGVEFLEREYNDRTPASRSAF
jgi:hypothetical protein